MGDDQPKTFATADNEIRHWKGLANEYEQRLTETKEELDEFQEGSRALEAELEAELEHGEKRIAELEACRFRCEQENDLLKEKLDDLRKELSSRVHVLEDEKSRLVRSCTSLSNRVRDLEQNNDDLERCRRNMSQTLEDFEHQLNRALERNAFLELELDEKDRMKEVVQRLKDESRDLRHELYLAPRLARSSERIAEDGHNFLHSGPLTLQGATVHSHQRSSQSGVAPQRSERGRPVANGVSTATSPLTPDGKKYVHSYGATTHESLTMVNNCSLVKEEDEEFVDDKSASRCCWPFCRKRQRAKGYRILNQQETN